MKKKNIFLIGIGSIIATAAALFFIRKKKQQDGDGEEKPPKGAPQLKIENPGSQDDFPKPPKESDIG